MSQTRYHRNGDTWSVQALDRVRAPGSGWYEIARIVDEAHAEWFALVVARGDVTRSGGELIGHAIARARQQGRDEGVAAERAVQERAERERQARIKR